MVIRNESSEQSWKCPLDLLVCIHTL